MAKFSRKEASGAVILLIYMSGKLQGLRDNEIFTGIPLFDCSEARLNPRRHKVGDLWKLGNE